MTVRERLSELIKEALSGKMLVKTAETIAPIIAEQLLANGVIALPCNVGDKVYVVDNTTDNIVYGEITNLEFNIHTTPREWITVVGNYPFFGKLEEKNRIDLLLDKTVFLTKEEAERALKVNTKIRDWLYSDTEDLIDMDYEETEKGGAE